MSAKFALARRRALLAGMTLVFNFASRAAAAMSEPEQFGAKGDGVSDDSDAFRQALTSADRVRLRNGRRYALRGVSIPEGVEVYGNGAVIVELGSPNPKGDPMLWISGSSVRVSELRFEGARRSHADLGLSDSFNGGAKGSGRAFLAAIRVDGGGKSLRDIAFDRCSFEELFGACIAARNVSELTVSNCRAARTNFELLFMANTESVSDINVVDNSLDRIGTGNGIVNSNGIVVGNARAVRILRNRMSMVERNAVKLEQTCEDVVIAENQLARNVIGNFGFVQVQSLGINSARGIVIERNRASQVGAGFSFNSAHLSDVQIRENEIIGTRGPQTGDGIQLANGDVSDVEITDNTLLDISRHGIVIGNQRLDPKLERIAVRGNRIRLLPNSTGAAVQVFVPASASREEAQIQLEENQLCAPGASGQLRVFPAPGPFVEMTGSAGNCE